MFLFSIVMILGGIGCAVYLFATGQAGTVDGLFLVLTSLLVAAVFAMYLKYMIGRAMEAAKAPAPAAKTAVASQAAKPAPAPAAQS